MKSKSEIAKQFRKHKGASDKGLSNQWQNTTDCQAFYAGNFMNYTDSLIAGDALGRVRNIPVQFSLVKPYVNSVRGFMAQNRSNVNYVARVDNKPLQQMYSKFANAQKDYVRENANADQVETQMDGDMLINGYAASETAMSYGDGYSSRNPNGEIVIGRLDPNHLGWDATARSPNLLDSRYVWYRRVYALEEALDLFSDSDKEDFETANDQQDGKRQFNPNGGRYDKIQALSDNADDYDYEDEKNELVKVYFYQWYEIETFYRAKNPVLDMTDPQMQSVFDDQLQSIAADQNDDDDYALDPRAEIISCNAKTKKEIEDIFEDAVDFEPFRRRVYYTAVLSGSKVFAAYRNACQQGFTVKFKTGDFDESNKMWVGMVNSLRDPVLYYNKALTELMVLIASQAKGGVMVEESALAGDIAEFEDKYADTQAVLIVADNAISGGKIKPKQEPPNAGGLDGVIQLTTDAIDRVGGIDRSFFAATGDANETATLQRQRIKQAMTILATYFDNILLYKKEQAALLLPMMRIQAENNDGSLFKALADDGDVEYLRMSPDNLADEYDQELQEGPDSATRRDEQATNLGQLTTLLINAQDFATAKAVMAVSVKYLDLDFEDEQTIIQALQPPQQQQIDPQQFALMQQQLEALTSDTHQAELKRTLSEASLNMIAGEEKISNIKKNNAAIRKTNADAAQTVTETSIIRHQPATETRVTA